VLRSRDVLLVSLLAATAGACAQAQPGEPDEDGPAATPAASTAPAASSVAAPSDTAKDACADAKCWSIERCEPSTGACVPACPEGEVYVPATGPDGFVMGRGFTLNGGATRLGKGHRADSDRPHRVVLTRPFCMDETEVTVAAMKACVEAGKCDAPKIYEVRANYPKKLDHPANEASWPKAKKFCLAHDKALPTEAQWEWAATGGDGRKWPWGDEQPTCEHADFVIGVLVSPGGDSGCHGGGTSPVKSHPKGAKEWPTGKIHDLAGNVWEWCEDTFASYPAERVVDPVVVNPRTFVHVVRGGGWNRSVLGIRAAFRGAATADYEVPGLGFRCVRNPAPR
jgi:formylglycine-generating enzyme required for sulfatase activity